MEPSSEEIRPNGGEEVAGHRQLPPLTNHNSCPTQANFKSLRERVSNVTLSDIAAGLKVTAEQRDRGVALLDDTGTGLAARLSEHREELPCDPEAAVAVLRAYAAGSSVGDAAREADLPPVTAAKALHLLGIEGVTPLSPRARAIVRDWLAADLSRADARTLTGASEAEFALAAYVETHDPLEGVREAVEAELSNRGNGAVEKREVLGETMSDVVDLL